RQPGLFLFVFIRVHSWPNPNVTTPNSSLPHIPGTLRRARQQASADAITKSSCAPSLLAPNFSPPRPPCHVSISAISFTSRRDAPNFIGSPNSLFSSMAQPGHQVLLRHALNALRL